MGASSDAQFVCTKGNASFETVAPIFVMPGHLFLTTGLIFLQNSLSKSNNPSVENFR